MDAVVKFTGPSFTIPGSSSEIPVSAANPLPISGVGATGATGPAGPPGPNGALSIKIQKFILTGTYTPTTGLVYAIVECVGNGGGGGGVTSATANSGSSGGGGGGSYARKILSSTAIGASQTVTIGATGTGGAAGNNDGTAGGDVSFGTLCVGKGGGAGTHANTSTQGTGGAGGVAGTGDVTITGAAGENGTNGSITTDDVPGGLGGGAPLFGSTTLMPYSSGGASNAGAPGAGYGSGGSGARWLNVASSNQPGGTGATGICIVTEYIITLS